MSGWPRQTKPENQCLHEHGQLYYFTSLVCNRHGSASKLHFPGPDVYELRPKLDVANMRQTSGVLLITSKGIYKYGALPDAVRILFAISDCSNASFFPAAPRAAKVSSLH